MTNNTRSRSESVRSVSQLGCGAFALLALGCGGANLGPDETRVPAASAGDEPPPSAAETSSAAAPESEPEKPARGRVVVQAKCAGQPVVAHGHMPIERGLVVDFEMGQEFTAAAGTRHIEVAMFDNTVLVDKPTLQLDIEVAPKKLNTIEAVFPWAKVQLNVLAHGAEQPPMPVKLIRKGNVVAEIKSGGPHVMISPGTYEAEVTVRGKKARVKGLVFFEGTSQVVPVRAVP
jgi:hypothetical protein